MPNIKQGLVWDTLKPASIFDETGLYLEPLLFGLDRKLQKLSVAYEERNAGTRFRSWLKQTKSEIVALVFHAGEIASDGDEKLSLHIIADFGQTRSVSVSFVAAKIEILRCSISDLMGLAHLCTENGGSGYRAFFSGELLIGARCKMDIEMLKMHSVSVHDIFEDGNVLCDIGTLVGRDISEKVFSNGNGNRKDNDISEKEFVNMAMESMKRRRVNPHMHEKVLPYAKKALLV